MILNTFVKNENIESEFERYMKLPLRSYADFNNWDAYYKIMKFIQEQ